MQVSTSHLTCWFFESAKLESAEGVFAGMELSDPHPKRFAAGFGAAKIGRPTRLHKLPRFARCDG